MPKQTTDIVIAGGGTAGWMAAALLQKVLGASAAITLVESERIATVGVGEATIPPIQMVNRVLGIDERDFLQKTGASIKLAISFEGWTRPGHRYFHTFGAPGQSHAFCPFHHYWVRARQLGAPESLWDYDLNYQAILQNRFAPVNTADPRLQVPYAYHFDATRYAQYLRGLSETLGVQRREGRIIGAERDPDTGDIRALRLEDGARLAGDLFIDCSGFRGLLIQGELRAGFTDWSQWLPCDRAVSVASERLAQTLPYTRAMAHAAGWQWHIPLQHRNGNGLVYSSRHLSDDEAGAQLLARLEAPALKEPVFTRFTTGFCPRPWHHNVVAVGLASGFLEPLESTSIYLIQSAVVRLLKLMPGAGSAAAQAAEYNRQARREYEAIRDFLVMHYHLNGRGEDFWRQLRAMALPETLAHKLALFREQGTIARELDDIFTDASWLQVMVGQGLIPRGCHPLAVTVEPATLRRQLAELRQLKQSPVAAMPSHDDYLAGRY